MSCKKYEVDENVVVHGATADTLHVVLEGIGKVSALSQVGMVRAGDVFGQEAMRLSGATNPTQVSAYGGCITTLSITTSALQSLDIKGPELRKREKAKKK